MPIGALRPSGRIREFGKLTTALCLAVTVLALAGCGLLPFGGDKSASSADTPAPQTAAAAATPGAPDSSPASAAPSGEFVQVPAPPPAAPMDPLVAAGPLDLSPEGSLGALGLNLESYFDDTAEAPERITKLERAVAAVQRDLRTLAPPIQRLIAVERDIQALIAQLSELTAAAPPGAAAGYRGASPPPGYSAAALAAPGSAGGAAILSAQQPPAGPGFSGGAQAPPTGGGATVYRLRTGEHADKTRIVLDVSGPAAYRYDLDNTENLLVIELPQAGWSGTTQETFRKSPVVASYAVQGNGSGGNRVVIGLKKSTAIVYESVIKPNGKDFYRIVIDLKK